MRLPLDVAVADVDAAVTFYETVLQATSRVANEQGARMLVLKSGVVLRIASEDVLAAQAVSGRYERGKDLLLELCVPDVDEWLEAFVGAGATVTCRLAASSEDGILRQAIMGQRTSYAQVLDPFGHRWAIACDERAAE